MKFPVSHLPQDAVCKQDCHSLLGAKGGCLPSLRRIKDDRCLPQQFFGHLRLKVGDKLFLLVQPFRPRPRSTSGLWNSKL